METQTNEPKDVKKLLSEDPYLRPYEIEIRRRCEYH